jgi:hypothetical protein
MKIMTLAQLHAALPISISLRASIGSPWRTCRQAEGLR